MVRLTQSLQKWLIDNHPEKLPLIMLGHLELFTEKMEKEYLTWCLTKEGRQYLKGGSKYKAAGYEAKVFLIDDIHGAEKPCGFEEKPCTGECVYFNTCTRNPYRYDQRKE